MFSNPSSPIARTAPTTPAASSDSMATVRTGVPSATTSVISDVQPLIV